MQSWNDIRCLSNVWELTDELPSSRFRHRDHARPEIEALRDQFATALNTWERTGNLAHLGLGAKLGEGNFSQVFALGDQLVAKFTSVVSDDVYRSGSNARSEGSISASGSLDLGVLYADFCLDNTGLDLLPVIHGYARHGDRWCIISERLEPAGVKSMRDLQGPASTIGLRMLQYIAHWPFQHFQWHIARAMNELLRWSGEIDVFVPCHYDLHTANIMCRADGTPVLNDPFIAY